MKRFLVDRTSIENVNVVQSEAEVEEPLPNVANEVNPNEIVRDPGLRKKNSCVCSGYSRPSEEGIHIEGSTATKFAKFSSYSIRKEHLPPNFI
jgi:hypothetical protein